MFISLKDLQRISADWSIPQGNMRCLCSVLLVFACEFTLNWRLMKCIHVFVWICLFHSQYAEIIDEEEGHKMTRPDTFISLDAEADVSARRRKPTLVRSVHRVWINHNQRVHTAAWLQMCLLIQIQNIWSVTISASPEWLRIKVWTQEAAVLSGAWFHYHSHTVRVFINALKKRVGFSLRNC